MKIKSRFIKYFLPGLFVVFFVIFYFIRDVPAFLVTYLCRGFSGRKTAFIVKRMSISPLGVLRINNLELYQKHNIAGPEVYIGKLIINPGILSLLRCRFNIEEVICIDTEISQEYFKAQFLEDKEKFKIPEISNLKTNFRFKKFVIGKFKIRELSFNINVTEKNILIENLEINFIDEGWAKGKILIDKDYKDILINIYANVKPEVFIPLMGLVNFNEVGNFLRRFSFKDPVILNLNAKYIPDESKVVGEISILTGDFLYNNLRFSGMNTALSFKIDDTNKEISTRWLNIMREEGSIRGKIFYDIKHDFIDFDLETSCYILPLFKLVDISSDVIPSMLQFDMPIYLNGSGKIYFSNGSNTYAKIKMFTPSFNLGAFKSYDLEMKINIKGNTNTFEDIKFKICEGNCAGTIALYNEGLSHETVNVMNVHMSISDVSVKKLLTIAGIKSKVGETSGNMSGMVTLKFYMLPGQNFFDTCEGSGYIVIGKGQIFTLPLFGGFTELVKKVVPILNLILTQTDVEVKFRIKDRKVFIDKVLIEGDIFSIRGKVVVNFDGTLEGVLELRLLKEKTFLGKILHALLKPVSWLVEFGVRGTLSSPEWYLTTFSKDVFNKVGILPKN